MYLRTKQFSRALADTNRVLSSDPNSRRALDGLAKALYELNRFSECLAVHKKIIEISSEPFSDFHQSTKAIGIIEKRLHEER